MVETISLGTPTGRACIAAVAIAVLPEPPADRTPWIRPSSYRRRASAAAAPAMAPIAAPRSPAAPSAATSTPVAAPTSSRVMSGSTRGGSSVPTSASSTSTPAAAQAVAQELELLALRVERPEQQDRPAALSGRRLAHAHLPPRTCSIASHTSAAR